MSNEARYIFGPVPSRRLGRSLGVDIVPFKVCSLDCLYCQLGSSGPKITERAEYAPIEEVLAELRKTLDAGVLADYITISGSGEPTLHSRLGELIDRIKKITSTPVALITNATLLDAEDVRRDAAKADLVVPSLDAGDEETFGRINRPHPSLTIEKLIAGLVKFREQYSGQLWLEVFVLHGINTSAEQIAKIRRAIDLIKPDKIQLNTSVRPPASSDAKRAADDELCEIAQMLGPRCDIIAGFSAKGTDEQGSATAQRILSILRRRPCSLEDIHTGLDISPNQAIKAISQLHQQGSVETVRIDGKVFYKAC